MPVQKGKNCVSDEMHRWGQGELHSGVGKKGVDGKVVPKGKAGQKQALAIAINECSHSERLQSIGYSEEVANQVDQLLGFAEIDWEKQFQTGKGPGPRVAGNYEKDNWFGKPAPSIVPDKKTRKDNPKQNDDAEMLSGPALPKGPGNPQGGSSKEVYGMRMLG